jgi:hypothetical protein
MFKLRVNGKIKDVYIPKLDLVICRGSDAHYYSLAASPHNGAGHKQDKREEPWVTAAILAFYERQVRKWAKTQPYAIGVQNDGKRIVLTGVMTNDVPKVCNHNSIRMVDARNYNCSRGQYEIQGMAAEKGFSLVS